MAIQRCSNTGLQIPECSCTRCLHRNFDRYYAEREADRMDRGVSSPEQLGRIAAREQIARSTA